MKNVIAIYADGGVIKVNPSPYGGTWAFCFVDADGNRTLEQSGVITTDNGVDGVVSNNVSELAAVTTAVNMWRTLNSQWWLRPITIYTDSQVTIHRLQGNAQLNGVPYWLINQVMTFRTLRDKYPHCFSFVLLDGHPTKAQLKSGLGKRGNPVSCHNVWCDEACRLRADEYYRECLELQTQN